MSNLFQQLGDYIQSHPFPQMSKSESTGGAFMPSVMMGLPEFIVLIQILKERQEPFECCVLNFQVINPLLQHHNGMGSFMSFLRNQEGQCLGLNGLFTEEEMLKEKISFLDGLQKERTENLYPFNRVDLPEDEVIDVEEILEVNPNPYVFGEDDSMPPDAFLAWKAEFDAAMLDQSLESRSVSPALRL